MHKQFKITLQFLLVHEPSATEGIEIYRDLYTVTGEKSLLIWKQYK